MIKKFEEFTIKEVSKTCDKRDGNCTGRTGEYELEEGKCPFYGLCDIFIESPGDINQDLLDKEVTLSDTGGSAET